MLDKQHPKLSYQWTTHCLYYIAKCCWIALLHHDMRFILYFITKFECSILCIKINHTLSNHNTLTSPGRRPRSLDKPTCTRQSPHVENNEPFSFLQALSSLALYRPKMQEVISLVVGSLSKLPTGK